MVATSLDKVHVRVVPAGLPVLDTGERARAYCTAQGTAVLESGVVIAYEVYQFRQAAHAGFGHGSPSWLKQRSAPDPHEPFLMEGLTHVCMSVDSRQLSHQGTARMQGDLTKRSSWSWVSQLESSIGLHADVDSLRLVHEWHDAAGQSASIASSQPMAACTNTFAPRCGPQALQPQAMPGCPP